MITIMMVVAISGIISWPLALPKATAAPAATIATIVGSNIMQTDPIMKDARGNRLPSTSFAGQLVVLSTTIHNNNNQDAKVPFVAPIEVRDRDGITVYFQWHMSELNSNDQVEIGLSWLPEKAGKYELRTFVISGLVNPQILTSVKISEVIIIE